MVISSPDAEITHQLPGRVRLRVATCRHHRTYFDQLRQKLSEAPSVMRVDTNPRTGSVLIRHSGDFEAVADHARTAGLFCLADKKKHDIPISEQFRRNYAMADAWLRNPGGGEINSWAMVSLAFAAMATVQLFRGPVLGSASTLAWTAVTAMMLALKGQSAEMAMTQGGEGGGE